MPTYATSTNVQEMAAAFANSILATVNAQAAEAAGVEVLWFRAIPDKRNQDVIFQTYTLWGVSDCPLKFKAVYTDTGYDDAAIMYNIMGMEYQVPLTLEIAVNTWYEVTEHDGTIPQKGDIVFIPMSNKLVEVVSMTPVKAIAAQITSFKVNCSIYKPSRARIVGEDLKTSIDNNTTSLEKAFGDEIRETFLDIVDDKELSLFSSTEKDKDKELGTAKHDVITHERKVNIVQNDIKVDGHVVARSYYNMNVDFNPVVEYYGSDSWAAEDYRALSCWINLVTTGKPKNIKSISLIKKERGYSYLNIQVAGNAKFKVGETVLIERGNIAFYGTVESTSPLIIKISCSLTNAIEKTAPTWYMLPGFTITNNSDVNILSSNGKGGIYVDIKGGRFIIVGAGGKEMVFQLTSKLSTDKWYGLIVNFGSTTSVDIYDSIPKLNKIYSLSGENKNWKEGGVDNYYLSPANTYMTNIRLYTEPLNDIDKQIIDLITYNIKNDSKTIINDSANIYLDKPYYGEQR